MMLTASGSTARSNLRRLLGSVLASAALNVIGWMLLPAQLSALHTTQTPREIVRVSRVRLRIERRARQPKRVPVPRRRAPDEAVPTTMLAPPPPAYISLPPGWSRQEFAFLGTTETAEWLNWSKTKHSERWVPRVFLWRMKTESGYMQRPSLHDAVRRVLSTLAQDAKIHVSKAQRLCDGRREGWFLSYVKPDDDPPLHFDETVLLADGNIYRAMYIRSVSQPEDSDTREALNSLCRF